MKGLFGMIGTAIKFIFGVIAAIGMIGLTLGILIGLAVAL